MTNFRLAHLLLRILLFALFISTASLRCLSPSAAAAAVTMAVAQTESGWKRRTGRGEEFSVMLPGEAAVYVNFITSEAGKRSLERIYNSYSRGSVYLVVSYEGGSFKDTLENFKAHHLQEGEITFERDIMLDSFKGKQYRLKQSWAVGVMQIYLTKRHAYAVVIMEASDDPPLTQYFLSTFSLKQTGDVVNQDANKASQESLRLPVKQASDFPQAGQDGVEARPYSPKDVDRKAVAVSRPEPSYTEEARHHGIEGTVVLRGVLSSTGEVTGVRVMSGLPQGLTENAIDATRYLKFIPAIKDGHFVPQYIQIEYNFHLY